MSLKCGAEIIHVVEEDEDDSVDAEDENEESGR